MKIGLVIPTRGLVFTDAVVTAIRQLMESGLSWDFAMPSTLGIPDCFNYPISHMISRDEAISHFWLVEEDVVSPCNALQKLISLDTDVGVIDYPLRTGWGCCAFLNEKILWAGTGCTLVRREVFEKIGYPYFEPMTYWIKDGYIYEKHPEIKNTYGGHDIHFGLQCRELGFNIKEVKGQTCEHLELITRGKPGENQGVHTIKIHKKIERRQHFTRFIVT